MEERDVKFRLLSQELHSLRTSKNESEGMKKLLSRDDLRVEANGVFVDEREVLRVVEGIALAVNRVFGKEVVPDEVKSLVESYGLVQKNRNDYLEFALKEQKTRLEKLVNKGEVEKKEKVLEKYELEVRNLNKKIKNYDKDPLKASLESYRRVKIAVITFLNQFEEMLNNGGDKLMNQLGEKREGEKRAEGNYFIRVSGNIDSMLGSKVDSILRNFGSSNVEKLTKILEARKSYVEKINELKKEIEFKKSLVERAEELFEETVEWIEDLVKMKVESVLIDIKEPEKEVETEIEEDDFDDFVDAGEDDDELEIETSEVLEVDEDDFDDEEDVESVLSDVEESVEEEKIKIDYGFEGVREDYLGEKEDDEEYVVNEQLEGSLKRLLECVELANEGGFTKIRILSADNKRMTNKFMEKWQGIFKMLGFEGTVVGVNFKDLSRSSDKAIPIVIPKKMNTHKGLWSRDMFENTWVIDGAPGLLSNYIEEREGKFDFDEE